MTPASATVMSIDFGWESRIPNPDRRQPTMRSALMTTTAARAVSRAAARASASSTSLSDIAPSSPRMLSARRVMPAISNSRSLTRAAAIDEWVSAIARLSASATETLSVSSKLTDLLVEPLLGLGQVPGGFGLDRRLQLRIEALLRLGFHARPLGLDRETHFLGGLLALALFELGDLVVELGLQAGLGFTEFLGEVVLAGGNQLRDQTLNGLVYRRANAVFERHRFSLKATR